MQATWLWPLWQALVLSLALGFTSRGKQRFVQWVTGLALNVEEHTVTQSLVALGRAQDWKALESFAEYGSWNLRLLQWGVARRLCGLPNRAWHGYSVWAGDDTKVHRNSKDVWGTCTFHEYTARCPNRASTVRAHNWVVLGALLGNPGQPAHFLPVAGRLYFRKAQLPPAQNGPPVAFRTKCELLVELAREHQKACTGKTLGVFDGGYALRNVVRPLVKPDAPGQPRIDVLTRLRQDARLYRLPPAQRKQGQQGATPKWGKRLPPPRQGGRWPGAWQEGAAFIYGRQRQVRFKEVLCLWRVLGHDVVVKAVVAQVEGYKKRFTLVTSATDLSGLQVVEVFCARFRQEDGFRDLKQRLGWEECKAWTRHPIERTTQAVLVTLTALRLLQYELQEERGTIGGCTRRGTRIRPGPACWMSSGCCGSTVRKSGAVWRPGWTARQWPGTEEADRLLCEGKASPWWAETPAADARCARPAPRRRGLLCFILGKTQSSCFPRTHCLSVPEVSAPPTPTPRCRPKPLRRREVIPSLAVMPLVHTNYDPDTEYLSDGITESIINLLSLLPGLRVMARSTVFRFKGCVVDAQAVGRALRVRAVLVGQLFQSDNNRLFLKIELVDVKDGSRIWGEHYNGELSDILAVEKEIVQEIAKNLRLRVTGEQQRRLNLRLTENPEAYRSYLQGRYHWNKRTAKGLKESIKLFERAIDIDPTYALAYSGVADAYLNLGGWGHVAFREAYPCAKAAAIHALAIDETLAEAKVSLAMALKEYDWDWPMAGVEYERALALNPNYAVAHQWYGEYLAAVGRHDEAITAFKRAIELEPLSLIIHATLGRHGFYFARQYDQAIAQLRKTLDMDENFWVARLWLGWTYANVGRLPEAISELQAAHRLDNNLEILAALGYTYGRADRVPEAQQTLDELQKLSTARYVSPMLGALITIGMGEHGRAFAWLEQSYADRAQMLTELNAEPAFDPLRGDPRFADLLRRVGLEAA